MIENPIGLTQANNKKEEGGRETISSPITIASIGSELEGRIEVRSRVSSILSKYGKICILSIGFLLPGAKAIDAQSIRVDTIGIENIVARREQELARMRPREHLIPKELGNLVVKKFFIGEGMYVSMEMMTLNLIGQFNELMDTFKASHPQTVISDDSIELIRTYYSPGNILITDENIATDSLRFRGVLYHERMHKYIMEDLTHDELEVLNRARDSIIDDYKKWEKDYERGLEELTRKGQEEGSDFDFSAEYQELRAKIYNPLDDIFYTRYDRYEYATKNKGEFFPTITGDAIERGYLEKFEDYLRVSYPNAYTIFERMKTKAIGEPDQG